MNGWNLFFIYRYTLSSLVYCNERTVGTARRRRQWQNSMDTSSGSCEMHENEKTEGTSERERERERDELFTDRTGTTVERTCSGDLPSDNKRFFSHTQTQTVMLAVTLLYPCTSHPSFLWYLLTLLILINIIVFYHLYQRADTSYIIIYYVKLISLVGRFPNDRATNTEPVSIQFYINYLIYYYQFISP